MQNIVYLVIFIIRNNLLFELIKMQKMTLEDKNVLIGSMEKLIHHIASSSQNQKEIFESLSYNDLKKIIINFQDQNPKLRSVSFLLLAQLLYNNSEIKQKFCNTMGIYPLYGKIALNQNFSKIKQSKLPQILSLLKTNSLKSQQKALFWYIDFLKDPLMINYVHREKLITIDPATCFIGFISINAEEKETTRTFVDNFISSSIENKNKYKALKTVAGTSHNSSQQKNSLNASWQLNTPNHTNSFYEQSNSNQLSSTNRSKHGLKLFSVLQTNPKVHQKQKANQTSIPKNYYQKYQNKKTIKQSSLNSSLNSSGMVSKTINLGRKQIENNKGISRKNEYKLKIVLNK